MTYKLKFHPDALKEWEKAPVAARDFFKEKLKERLENPHNPKSRLSGGFNIYKIKIHNPPYRLTYHVNDNELIVTTMSVGRRDGSVYKKMIERLSKK